MNRKMKILVLSAVVVAVIIGIFTVMRSESTDRSKAKDSGLRSVLFIDDMELDAPDKINLEECTLSNMAPYIAQLKREKLPDSDIRTALQAIIYVEARYHGIKDPACVVLSDNDYSYYSAQGNKIYIGKSAPTLGDYKELIRTILHLNYHCYQRKVIEVYDSLSDEGKELSPLFDKPEKYLYELVETSDERCADDTDEYESDAQSYARSRLDEYTNVILDYWNVTLEK